MSPRTRALRAVRRVDESMNLLTDLSRDALDPGYRTAAPRRGRWWVVASATVVIGLMIGGSVGERLRAAPAEQQEREQLVQRIEQANAASDALRARVATLNAENKALSDAALGNDPAAVAVQRQIDALAPATGMQAVTGPGVVLVADDAESPVASGSKVVDVDLRQAVNGHRLSSRTAIRGAGDAITVDYRSLTQPYHIEAIGDPDGLLRAFPATGGGAWWAYLKQNYGIRYDLSTAGNLRLEADPGLGLRVAQTKP